MGILQSFFSPTFFLCLFFQRFVALKEGVKRRLFAGALHLGYLSVHTNTNIKHILVCKQVNKHVWYML